MSNRKKIHALPLSLYFQNPTRFPGTHELSSVYGIQFKNVRSFDSFPVLNRAYVLRVWKWELAEILNSSFGNGMGMKLNDDVSFHGMGQNEKVNHITF